MVSHLPSREHLQTSGIREGIGRDQDGSLGEYFHLLGILVRHGELDTLSPRHLHRLDFSRSLCWTSEGHGARSSDVSVHSGSIIGCEPVESADILPEFPWKPFGVRFQLTEHIIKTAIFSAAFINLTWADVSPNG